MANKYSEELFGAIDEILRKRLEGLSKDSTILCSIEDNSEAENGKYIVLNNALRFAAYSENIDYPVGQNVWVLVPDGDYNNTKIIIGKYVSEDTAAFNWVDPFKDFADMTGNLAASFKDIGEGLTANDPNIIEKSFGAIVNEMEINTNGFKGLNRIAISADFATYFSSDNPPISGDYGLRVDLITDRVSDNRQTIELNTSKMNGNVYGKNGIFFEQKMVYDFDPEEIGNIQQIYLTFYQNQDFVTKTGMYNLTSDNQLITDSNDIFIKNIKVMLGYSTSKIRTTTALLSTFDSTTYNIDDLDNKRNLVPRFAYKNANGTFTFINTYEDYINAEEINPALRNLKLRLYYRDSKAPIEPRAGQFYRESWEERPFSINEENLWRTWDKETGVSSDFRSKFEIPVKFGNSGVPSESVKIAFCFKKTNANLTSIESRFKEIAQDLNIEYTENDLEVVQLILLNASIWYSDITQKPYGEITSPYYNAEAPGLTEVTRYFWNYIISLMRKTPEELGEESEIVNTDFGNFHAFACKLINTVIYDHYDYSSDRFGNFDKAKYILENVYVSDALVFTNEASTEEAVADLLQGLQLTAIDAQAGVYNLYKASTNANSELIKMSDTNVKRNIQVSFTSYTTGEEELGKANRIYWLIPKTGTMIKEPAEGISYGENYNIVKYTQTEFENYIKDYDRNGMQLYHKDGSSYIPIIYENDKIHLDKPNAEEYSSANDFFTLFITDIVNNTAIFYMKSVSYIIVGNNMDSLPETINKDSSYVTTISNFINYYSTFSDDEIERKLAEKERDFLMNNYNTYWIVVEDRWDTRSSNLKKSSLTFQIKSIFRKSLTSNKIFAAICRNEKMYPNSIELFFGVKGTNDTDYTLSLIPVKEVYINGTTETAPNVWTIGSTNSIQLSAALYDSNDKTIPSQFEFKIVKGNGEEQNQYFTLKPVENEGAGATDSVNIEKIDQSTSLDNCGGVIIKCTATPHTTTSTDITQYYILPLRSNRDYSYVDGPDTITYDANKINPEYYNVKYAVRDSYDNEIRFSDEEDVEDGIKKEIIVNGSNEQNNNDNASPAKRFLPTLTEDGYLVPTISYVEGEDYDFYIKFSNDRSVEHEVIWKQPILVTLNNYTNSLIDGISNDSDGRIRDRKSATASSVMSVVSRNTEGKLTGIVIGSLPEKTIGVDPQTLDEIKEQRNGIIGYNNGTEIYGLFDKGNAFIKGNGITISTTPLNSTESGAVISRVDDSIIQYQSKEANAVLIGPSNNSGTPTFRKLTAADIPSIGGLSSTGEIGNTGNLAVFTNADKKLTADTLAVNDPEADGNSITYIATISQNSIGKITATKATIPTASTSQAGIVQLIDSINSDSTSNAATANSVKTAYDLANSAIQKSVGTAAGDIIYWTGANTPTRLAKGQNGQVLKLNNSGLPSWDNLSYNDINLNNWTGSSNITTIGTLSAGSVPWARLTNVPTASTSATGVVQLYDGVDSTSTTLGATANAVNVAYSAGADALEAIEDLDFNELFVEGLKRMIEYETQVTLNFNSGGGQVSGNYMLKPMNINGTWVLTLQSV